MIRSQFWMRAFLIGCLAVWLPSCNPQNSYHFKRDRGTSKYVPAEQSPISVDIKKLPAVIGKEFAEIEPDFTRGKKKFSDTYAASFQAESGRPWLLVMIETRQRNADGGEPPKNDQVISIQDLQQELGASAGHHMDRGIVYTVMGEAQTHPALRAAYRTLSVTVTGQYWGNPEKAAERLKQTLEAITVDLSKL